MLKKINLENYKLILLAALIARLIAVLFSQGYGMHDDHFLIIESSNSWANGTDYNNWLPWTKGGAARCACSATTRRTGCTAWSVRFRCSLRRRP